MNWHHTSTSYCCTAMPHCQVLLQHININATICYNFAVSLSGHLVSFDLSKHTLSSSNVCSPVAERCWYCMLRVLVLKLSVKMVELLHCHMTARSCETYCLHRCCALLISYLDSFVCSYRFICHIQNGNIIRDFRRLLTDLI